MHVYTRQVSVDTLDPRNGWDTDQFPMSYYETTLAMLTILKVGGFTTGGLNFDARIGAGLYGAGI